MEARIDSLPQTFMVQVWLFQTSPEGTHIFNLDGSVREVVAPFLAPPATVEPSAVMDREVVKAIVGAWDPPRTLCDEECACVEESRSLEHVLDAIDTRLRHLEMGAIDEAVARALRCQARTARRGLIRDEGLS